MSLEKFSLQDRVAIITGGAGFFGVQQAEAIAEAGGIPILWDIDGERAGKEAGRIEKKYRKPCRAIKVDITDPVSLQAGLQEVLKQWDRVHILVNNAANDPKPAGASMNPGNRFETFPLPLWNQDLSVGLTGSFLCSQLIGSHMVKKGGGVILNIASDLGVISPDQRIYRQEGLRDEEQPTKPVSYPVVKHALIGLTKYLATYWADKNIRVNSISPGGIYNGQPDEFVRRLTQLIPLGRMAEKNEYKAAVLFLISDASSYMTGANLVIDGGRTCW